MSITAVFIPSYSAHPFLFYKRASLFIRAAKNRKKETDKWLHLCSSCGVPYSVFSLLKFQISYMSHFLVLELHPIEQQPLKTT